ncbi:alkaline phosphatase [Chromobacterium subtsugae]|uniref:Alkaline phosphatase n=2 Tax=Chromobacterium subtsugae TaxID=251747 RepID=A0ABS7FA69_9NEIS|nr:MULTISPECIES: alkaline phosphatase [Chromobacterium]KUM04141.1 alkaline phosphatase [Chromobacterium subtsugae]KZE87786.1 alkaline phosphatase [Chromobacterium sp. F49]MBW7565267.1 alkaline phosphatase [Chromobacterium subtsugae]MBW8286882.1 alkaline phosphatase [Chromobacterium subtsugae]
MRTFSLSLPFLMAISLAACNSGGGSAANRPQDNAESRPPAASAKNVIFFLGDGMGIATTTAARIYSVGEDGQLTMDTLPESGFVKTFSNDAQVTDSAPSMSAYMTGVKMNNEVISMSTDTVAKSPNADLTSNCGAGNGKAVSTLLELAKAGNRATGVVTTTRVTHATPAATYSHVCHRDAEADIAAQLVPGSALYNAALKDGVDVVFGGGRQFFLPKAAGGKRADGRDLVAELKTRGYGYAADKAGFDAIDPVRTRRAVGLFTASHMSYDLDRDAAKEPSLAEMTSKAIAMLAGRSDKQGMFLMVEGGRIDHALHETTAKKALQDTVAFDQAIQAAINAMQQKDPGLKNTLIVVTADHDHTLVLNGYAKRTGKTAPGNPGVLGLAKDYVSGKNLVDADGMPYSIIGFGNGENRVAGDRSAATALTDDAASANDYHQEAAIRMPAGGETHGGTDVYIAAIGQGADSVHGFLENIEVFGLVKKAAGL